jgi:hypothetical protein
MPQITIPEQWRAKVCAILETEATGKLIEWTDDATKRFEASYLDAWPYEMYAALRSYLNKTNPTGCPKSMDYPTGETYEFFFAFKGDEAYGKILLRPDAKGIVIFSAHVPLKNKLDCD